MNSEPRSRRFDLHWLLRAISEERAPLVEEQDAAAFSGDEESTNHPAGWEVDEALDQIASEGCTVCPLCGAIVAGDGSVLG